MKLIVNDVKAKVAYVEQQRKRRDENTMKPRRFPMKPRTKRTTQIQLNKSMMENIFKSIEIQRWRSEMTFFYWANERKKREEKTNVRSRFYFSFSSRFSRFSQCSSTNIWLISSLYSEDVRWDRKRVSRLSSPPLDVFNWIPSRISQLKLNCMTRLNDDTNDK